MFASCSVVNRSIGGTWICSAPAHSSTRIQAPPTSCYVT
ncbi:UNVERIFIED_CONTAM: hypothetical protein GTU68_049677 [Idotea baltica]|nr:hypothetical protein [Idotea baltica]